MQAIAVEHLTKQYEYSETQPGLWGSLKGLVKRERKIIPAVTDISFSLAEGELVGFLGPNGAGKTTTLKVLSGILYPTSGSIQVLGHVPFERSVPFRKQFALVMGHKNQLWWDLPARQSIELNKAVYEVPDKDFKRNLDELSELLTLKDVLDVPVRKLSLGQRMKCELAAALIHKPRVLFLDEPTIGLDVVAQKSLRDFIAAYNAEKNTTIILTSHYMEDISRLCKRVVIIDRGVIVYDGLLSDLVRRFAHHKLLTLVFRGDGVRRADVEPYGEVVEFSPHQALLKVPREDVKTVASRILSSSLPVEDFLIHEMEVDDVIRMIFSRSG